MPRAAINTQPERFELKTVEGGFVEIKRMSYGAWVHRQDIAMDMEMSGTNKADAKSVVNMTQKRVALWEFSNCIVDHNLDDLNDNRMEFKNPSTLDILDARVGTEISSYISQMHDFDLGN